MFASNCTSAGRSFRVTADNREQNLQRNHISVKLPLKCLLCWPRGNELVSSFMILKCYSSLSSYKVRTAPFVSVGALFHRVFSEFYWHRQRGLSWFRQGPSFGCGFWGSSTTSGTWLAELLIRWWAQKGRKQLDFSVPHSVCRPNNYKHCLGACVAKTLQIIKINSQLFQALFSEESDFGDAFLYWKEKK